MAAPAHEPASREDLSAGPPAPGERALEGRLLAPCCYQGTLDVHESESAAALRMRIRGRLHAGETVEAVEASAKALTTLGGAVDMRLYPGMGHTINPDEIEAARALLTALL